MDYTLQEMLKRLNSLTENEYNSIKKTLKYIDEKKIPESYSSFMHNSFSSFLIREKYIEKAGFILVSNNWIQPLARWIGDRKVLEVMSGLGCLSYALKQFNVDIRATDNFEWYINKWPDSALWTDIESIDCISAINKYKDVDIIICSWPYMDEMANKILLTMREVNPKAVLIYIGENYGGCTASDSFFENLKYIYDEEIANINNIYPNWNGIHDSIYLCK